MLDARALDDGLVEGFARSFLGFGSPEAPYWLVTAEPLDERTTSTARIEAWHRLGERQLVDWDDFERAVGETAGRVPSGLAPQSSLPALLRIVLDAFGEPCAPFDVAEYLRTRAGRRGDRLALLHLFALPLRRTGRWDAHEISRLGALRSRSAFLETFASDRIGALSALAGEMDPRLVLMVGNVHGSYWERLAGMPLPVAPDVPLRWRRRGATLFVQIAQPDVIGSLNATRSGAVATFIRNQLEREPVGGSSLSRGE